MVKDDNSFVTNTFGIIANATARDIFLILSKNEPTIGIN